MHYPIEVIEIIAAFIPREYVEISSPYGGGDSINIKYHQIGKESINLCLLLQGILYEKLIVRNCYQPFEKILKQCGHKFSTRKLIIGCSSFRLSNYLDIIHISSLKCLEFNGSYGECLTEPIYDEFLKHDLEKLIISRYSRNESSSFIFHEIFKRGFCPSKLEIGLNHLNICTKMYNTYRLTIYMVASKSSLNELPKIFPNLKELRIRIFTNECNNIISYNNIDQYCNLYYEYNGTLKISVFAKSVEGKKYKKYIDVYGDSITLHNPYLTLEGIKNIAKCGKNIKIEGLTTFISRGGDDFYGEDISSFSPLLLAVRDIRISDDPDYYKHDIVSWRNIYNSCKNARKFVIVEDCWKNAFKYLNLSHKNIFLDISKVKFADIIRNYSLFGNIVNISAEQLKITYSPHIIQYLHSYFTDFSRSRRLIKNLDTLILKIGYGTIEKYSDYNFAVMIYSKTEELLKILEDILYLFYLFSNLEGVRTIKVVCNKFIDQSKVVHKTAIDVLNAEKNICDIVSQIRSNSNTIIKFERTNKKYYQVSDTIEVVDMFAILQYLLQYYNIYCNYSKSLSIMYTPTGVNSQVPNSSLASGQIIFSSVIVTRILLRTSISAPS